MLYWKNYEIENYFISPEVLTKYAIDKINSDNTGELFQKPSIKLFEDSVNEILMGKDYFNGDINRLNEYQSASPMLKRMIIERKKMSKFAEDVFKKYKEKTSTSILLNKSNYYLIVPFCPSDEISAEVTEKLDMLVKYLK
jgi:hypothetical protein